MLLRRLEASPIPHVLNAVRLCNVAGPGPEGMLEVLLGVHGLSRLPRDHKYRQLGRPEISPSHSEGEGSQTGRPQMQSGDGGFEVLTRLDRVTALESELSTTKAELSKVSYELGRLKVAAGARTLKKARLDP